MLSSNKKIRLATHAGSWYVDDGKYNLKIKKYIILFTKKRKKVIFTITTMD